MKSIIFDLGCNCGASLSYYMQKADLVVAVEANPVLCGAIRRFFGTSIRRGKLIVENCVVTQDADEQEVIFYIHKTHSPLSQFPKPSKDIIHDFEEVRVPAKPIGQLIKSYGMPMYIKIDLERYDQYILQSLITSKLLPQYVSAEVQDLKVVDLLIESGFYNAFKLVDGKSIHIQYRKFEFMPNKGARPSVVSFPRYSSGPFGNDVYGMWMDANTIRKAISLEGVGWKDLHATKIAGNTTYQYRSLTEYLLHRATLNWLFCFYVLGEGTRVNVSKILDLTRNKGFKDD